MYNEQRHTGAVKSRIHDTCLVAEPVVITIEGKDTELSLSDAVALQRGLSEAIQRVTESEKALKGDGLNYHLAIIAKAGAGMSFPVSKLDGKIIVDEISGAEAFANVSKEEAQAILDNCNIKIVMKADASSTV